MRPNSSGDIEPGQHIGEWFESSCTSGLHHRDPLVIVHPPLISLARFGSASGPQRR
jgi:hypothetical protein